MTALEEIKKALEGVTQEEAIDFINTAMRNWNRLPKLDADDLRDLAEELQRFSERRYASALESLQRENEEKSAWIKSATTEITKAIGGGSEMFTTHGDGFRVDPAFVASFIQYRRERHAESKKAFIQKERELVARAEAAEAEVKRLRNKVAARALTDKQLADEIESIDEAFKGGFGEGGGSPGEWWYERADELEHERKRRELESQLQQHNSRAALASTGGEHHGN